MELDYHQFHGADQLRGAPQAVQYPTQEGNPAGSRAQQRKPQLAETQEISKTRVEAPGSGRNDQEQGTEERKQAR